MLEKCVVLRALATKLKFELAIGLNGKVWVNSESDLATVLITNAILNSVSQTSLRFGVFTKISNVVLGIYERWLSSKNGGGITLTDGDVALLIVLSRCADCT